MVYPLPWPAVLLESAPCSLCYLWDAARQLYGLWWTVGAQSYTLLAGASCPTLQVSTQQNWVDGAGIPFLDTHHTQRYREPVPLPLHQGWTALWPQGKNGRLKSKEIPYLPLPMIIATTTVKTEALQSTKEPHKVSSPSLQSQWEWYHRSEHKTWHSTCYQFLCYIWNLTAKKYEKISSKAQSLLKHWKN